MKRFFWSVPVLFLLSCCVLSGWGLHRRYSVSQIVRISRNDQHARRYGKSREITGFMFAADGQSIVVSDSTGAITRWSLPEGTLIDEAKGDWGPITCLTQTPDNAAVVAGLASGGVRQWKDDSLELVREDRFSDGPVSSLALTSNGRRVVTACGDAIQVWDVSDVAKRVKEITLTTGTQSLAISSDGRFVAFGSATPAGNSVWKADSDEELVTGIAIFRVAFLGTTHTLAAASLNGRLVLWDCDQRCEVGGFTSLDQSGIFAIGASPDGKLLAVGGGTGSIHLWDVANRRQIANWRGHDAGITFLHFSPDGSLLGSACCDVGVNDNPGHSEVKIWRLGKGLVP
jgi:WD40 repeat protein